MAGWEFPKVASDLKLGARTTLWKHLCTYSHAWGHAAPLLDSPKYYCLKNQG